MLEKWVRLFHWAVQLYSICSFYTSLQSAHFIIFYDSRKSTSPSEFISSWKKQTKCFTFSDGFACGWLAANFSSQYQPWIIHQSHESKGNDHQIYKLLIVTQILLIIIRKCIGNSMENMHTDVGCKGLTYIFLNLYFDVNEFVDQRMPILCFFQVL